MLNCESYSLHQVAGNYKRGLLTSEEACKEMGNIIRDCYYVYFDKRGLHKHFTSQSWARFSEDYSFWLSKNDPISSTGKPWLTDSDDQEASIHDRSLFFHLMKCFHRTPDYYLPIPDDIIYP